MCHRVRHAGRGTATVGALWAMVPLGLAIALSPVPLMGIVAVLLGERSGARATAFLLGWSAAITVLFTASVLLAGTLGADAPQSRPLVGLITVALAAVLLVLAVAQWRGRPRRGAPPEPPGWLAGVGAMSTPRTGGLGLLLGVANPKNIAIAVSAGVVVAGDLVGVGPRLLAGAVFVVVASSTVLAPVVAHALAPQRLAAPLESLRGWLARWGAHVMTAVLVIVGLLLLMRGIGALR